ncbi:hypothetical protein BKA70DRAFT_1044631, partial [Coprinopsis sp. MPI-PUGE-AT-0042]
LTEAEKQEHMAKGQCFNCHGFGHTYHNCPRANVVRSGNSNRPPGTNMATHNIEMGMGDDEILEDLPIASAELFHYMDDIVDANGEVLWSRYTEPKDEWLEAEPFQDKITADWMRTNPEFLPRDHIGDALAMRAAHVLNVSQPYPGDCRQILQHGRRKEHFGVYRMSKSTYAIWDRERKCAHTVPAYRLDHPNFRLGRYYALHLAHQQGESFIFSPYPMTMGNAISVVTAHLLRD